MNADADWLRRQPIEILLVEIQPDILLQNKTLLMRILVSHVPVKRKRHLKMTPMPQIVCQCVQVVTL